MLVWLEAGLGLMFAVAAGARNLGSLVVGLSSSPVFFGFP